jgi:hypothetical protein
VVQVVVVVEHHMVVQQVLVRKVILVDQVAELDRVQAEEVVEHRPDKEDVKVVEEMVVLVVHILHMAVQLDIVLQAAEAPVATQTKRLVVE